jgi:hypothetical protein
MLSIHELAAALSLPAPAYAVGALVLYAMFWLACRRLSVPDGLTLALALAVIAAPHCRIYDGVALIPLFVKVASLRSWQGVLAYGALTPALYIMVLMGNPPVLLAGDSLLIFAALASALRFYRTQMTPNSRQASVPTAMATP